jgi:Rrf2 family protein
VKISQKGLYALQGLMVLARRYAQGAIRIRDIAYEENLPEKFLELILLELKNARIVESVRGAKGGYRLRRAPSEIHLSEIIRLIDGPLAPFGDAEQLRVLIDRDADHSALYKIFLQVRDAAAGILENKTLADVIAGTTSEKCPQSGERQGREGKSGGRKTGSRKIGKRMKGEANVLPMLAQGEGHD